MSHVTGTIQTVSPVITIGPDSGPATTPPNTWALNFDHVDAPTGTKFLMLHFRNASFPASNRLEVELGYDVDTFTSADGTDFWTRPVNIRAFADGLVRIRYITNGAATGSVQFDKYGRGERHAGEQDPTSLSNCDPFLPDPTYTEPDYDPFWYCTEPPNWENAACVTPGADVRAGVTRSVGMIISIHGDHVSTCSVTLVDGDKVISAGHCHTPAEALTSSVTFDYQTDCGGARPPGYNARFHKVKNVLNHRWDGGGDYSLLRLATSPAGIPPIQLRHDLPASGEQVFGIHHPNGAVKKLSRPHPGFGTVLSSSTAAVTVPSSFHVSGGSSGSGLFDTAGRIVGVLSSGPHCGSLGYFPTASILLDIAPTPPPPVTRDVMVVFDRSGSMSLNDGTGRTKIAVARDAVSLFVQLVLAGVGNRVGLISFSTTPSSPVDFNIASVINANKTILIGPAPFSGGKVGALSPGGNTSIGEGLDAARLQFPAPGANPRAILLLTDGLQNTPRMINAVEGALAGIDVHAIGFGTEANLDGPLLTALAGAHNGLYMRAGNGLALEKFFSNAFGNIFESGILMDPEFDLPANQSSGEPQTFQVCDEDTLTVVVGWDRPGATLLVEVTTPGGAVITAGSPGVEDSTGVTWTFLRIPLPQNGEREGTWSVRVLRPNIIPVASVAAAQTLALRYFINVIPSGGPRFQRMPDSQRYYTGDSINPLVLLRYDDGSWPEHGKVQVTVSRPDAGAGNILSREKMRAPVTLDGDTIPARYATLMALESEAGQPIIRYKEDTFDLFDDPANTEGIFEASSVFGRPLTDQLTVEGNYTFHFRATYGEECIATRELLWSLHVDVGVDPKRTVVTATIGGTRSDGKSDVTIVFWPRDTYGNNLGPGRLDGLSVTDGPGTTVTGPVQDNGDGSYTVPGVWDPTTGNPPGVVIGQPGRPCVPVLEPAKPESRYDYRRWILLWWLLLILALIILVMLLILIFR